MTAISPAVKPDAILAELSELWIALSEPEPGKPEAAGVLRACAMTLIAFVDDSSDPEALSETIVRVMRAHPSRAIVIRLRDDADVLESRVFAQCWMPFGQTRQVCCEQIEFSVSLNRVPDLASIVSPIAAPDVPRVVWFRSAKIESIPDIGDLLALGDKLIVDTSLPGAPTFADLRVLANAGFMLGDLAWTRLTRLRQLLAQLLSERRLSDIRTALIGYDGKEPAPEVRYLQAWLRSVLPGADITLRRIHPGADSRLRSIRVEADLNVRVEAGSAEYEMGSLHQHANLARCTEGDLLTEELNIMTHDRTFERVLQRMTVWTPPS